MRHCIQGLLVAALAASMLLAQSQELPSAPSATLQEKNKPAAPPPATTAPEPKQENLPAVPTTTPASPDKQEPPAAAPQQPATPPPPPQEEEERNPAATIVKTVNEVNIAFTVTDKHGRFVKDLKQQDFQILDDNKPAAQVLRFYSQTDLPLQVGLLVDASNSVRDRFKFEQEAAIEFLNQIIRPASDQAFVVGFDSTPEVTQDFTDSTERLSKGVRMLRPGGGTAMFDAIYFACRDKLMKAERRTATRRAIIVLSDGDDNQSHVTREEAIEMSQRAEVVVYAISTNVSGQKNRGDKILERIAEATGGRAFFPFKIQDVSDAFSDIQAELRSQYLVSYKPADFQEDGRYRAILLTAVNQKNLQVRSRRGYYAPKR
jgi:Ca-activated chloride channel homolog